VTIQIPGSFGERWPIYGNLFRRTSGSGLFGEDVACLNNGLPGSSASGNVYSPGIRMGGMIEGATRVCQVERARTRSSSNSHARNLRLFACERASSVNE